MIQLFIDQLENGIIPLLFGFILGSLFGWFIRGFLIPNTKRQINGKRVSVAIVNVIIVLIWSTSVINYIFQFNDSHTPWFLHALMGGVMGYLNENFGNWILKMMGRFDNSDNNSSTKL